MQIGIAPGRREEIHGAPLVGPSGERNDLCLTAVKYPREKVYATNLICWRCDAPSEEEIAACWPRLRSEIERVRPKLILALGALACEWLTGYPIGKTRGDLIRPEYNKSPHFEELFAGGFDLGDGTLPTILPTWHPAATLRIASLATDVIRDYAKIRPFLKGHYEPLQWDWRLVTAKDEAQEVLDSLAGRAVAIDVETEKDVSDAFGRIVCVAMATEDPRDIRAPNGDPAYFAYVFPVEVLRGLRWPKRVQWHEHNMQFDVPAIKREYGFWLKGSVDTMLLSWARDERPGRDEDSVGDRQRSGEAKKPAGPGYHGLKQLAAEYCLSPNTRVLKTDLRWATIATVEVGDTLIGFDEFPPRPEKSSKYRRKLRTSTVISKKVVILPRLRITTDQGVVVCSPDHSWLGAYPKTQGGPRGRNAPPQLGRTQGHRWIRSSELRPGDRISRYCSPWDTDDSGEAQYLRGFYDGEGFARWEARRLSASCAQLEGPVLDYVRSILTEKKFSFRQHETVQANGKRLWTLEINGDGGVLRFLGQIRPIRLLEKIDKGWEGRSIYGKYTTAANIISIEELEPGELVAIRTSTGTFIAEGLLSHNCGAAPGYGDEMKKSFGKTLEEIAAPQLIPLTAEEIRAEETLSQEDESPSPSRRGIQEPSTGIAGRNGTGSLASSNHRLQREQHNDQYRDVQTQTTTGPANQPETVAENAPEEGVGAEAQALAVDLLAGGDREPVGRSADSPAANGSDVGSTSAAATPAPKPTKRKGKKSAPLMRMETAAEARDRFQAWLQKLYAYNAFDAVNTVALPSRLPGKPCPATDTILMPAARAYARIHLAGIPVDLDRAKELQEEWTPWIEELEAELQQEAHEARFRNVPKLKRDLATREAYEDEHGPGTWPLGLPADVRKAMGPEERLRVAEAWLVEHGPNSWPGYEPINLASSLQLGKLLYGILKLPVKVRSKKTGKPSVGREAVADIDHPFVNRMEEVRTAKHVKASHLDPLPELAKGDGRIHANIWVNGATNYRRAITNPPMQQMPQEHPKAFWKKLAEVRSVIRPDPGYCLIEADYRQIELWGAALLSDDPTFLADLKSGDYHTRIVREVFHCDAEEGSVVFSHTRRIAKVANFAVLYRVEENTLAKAMAEGAGFGANQKPTSPREAGRFIRQWYARNRVYWQWQEDIIREVRRTGRIVNPLGEVRRFPLYDPMLDKQIVNFPVSSTCGAHSEISLIELEPIIRKQFGGSILFDTHDSLLFHIPIKKRRNAARLIREVMSEPKVDGWPPLDIEFKTSEENWRKMKVWDERI